MKKIGIVRHDRRISVAQQQQELVRWGADVVWDLGKNGQSLAELTRMKSARAGDTIAIWRLSLLPDRGRGSHDKMAADMSALLNTGARILELETGRACDTKADVAALVSIALKQIANGTIGRGVKGRPKKFTFTPDDLEWLALQWQRSDLRTVPDKVKAVAGRFSGFNRDTYYTWKDRIDEALPKSSGN